jgi:hypothetical protein
MRKDAPHSALPLLFLLALLLPSATALAASSPVASSAVYAESRQQPTQLQVKPRGHYSHVSVQDLKWSAWGQATTSAHGTLTFQFCFEESCSVSPFYAEPVTVSLSRIQSCRARRSYTLLALDVEGPLPEESFKTYRTSLAACQKPAGAHRARPKRG